jgi:hypothetical protein
MLGKDSALQEEESSECGDIVTFFASFSESKLRYRKDKGEDDGRDGYG